MKQLTKRGGTRSAEELLELVGLDPKRTLDSYPHELSGGQRQRVLIAMALTRDPKLVIADEPTTALDVTVQKQVIDLLNKLQHELGFAMVFVSHDLALVAEVANSITVMYAGQVVGAGPGEGDPHQPHPRVHARPARLRSVHRGRRCAPASGSRLGAFAEGLPRRRPLPSALQPSDKTSNVRPMLKRVANSDHYYAELPDSEPEAHRRQALSHGRCELMAEATNSAAVANNDEQTPIIFLDDIHVVFKTRTGSPAAPQQRSTPSTACP